MTDDLDRLKSAMQAETPTPDQARRAETRRLAMEKFAASQGLADEARPIPRSAGNLRKLWTGAIDMFSELTQRPALLASSALVMIGTVFIVSQNSGPILTGNPQIIISETDDSAGPFKVEEMLSAEMELTVKEAPKPVGRITAAEPQVMTKKLGSKDSFAQMPSAGTSSIVAMDMEIITPVPSSETFANGPSNPLKITATDPVSTFSIDVDTAAYSYVRTSILNGYLPPADAVRVEEMVNYFPYEYPKPDLDVAPFSTNLSVVQTPWNADTQLVHIALQGGEVAVENRGPVNLVFLIDTSGSMNNANKLPLLKQSFRLLLNTLNPTDQVAIVTYAGSAGVVLEPTAAKDASTILDSLNRLSAGGSTGGQAGLQQAYSLAETMSGENSIERIILATDGDFNVGINNPEALKDFVADKRDTGTYLSVLGFGRGNYRDDMMQSLAQNGNGTAAYIDTLAEAQKVLVDQVGAALVPIANDVKIQVEFNPALVAEYRLIGYETRGLAREDFNNDTVDAGEIGAGHRVTAIYEVTPTGSSAIKNDALRYQVEPTPNIGINTELGYVKLRYKTPGDSISKLLETPIPITTTALSGEAGFGVAIAGFGQLLRDNTYLGDWDMKDALALARTHKGSDRFGYRAEAITLMQLADGLSHQ